MACLSLCTSGGGRSSIWLCSLRQKGLLDHTSTASPETHIVARPVWCQYCVLRSHLEASQQNPELLQAMRLHSCDDTFERSDDALDHPTIKPEAVKELSAELAD